MQVAAALCIGLSLLLIGCSTVNLYYVERAQMIPYSEVDKGSFTSIRPEPAKLLLNGHYVSTGKNLVLLIRQFDKGSPLTIDDEIYEKLTIEIKDYTVGVPMKFDSPDMRFYYSSGSSGHVTRGHGIYATSGSGTLVIKAVEKNRIVVDLDLTMWATPAGAFPFEGRNVHVRELLSFEKKEIAELTPWLGIPDSSLGKEVYP